MKSKIAIIGGNGFVGKNLTTYFSEKDYHLIVADHSVKKNFNEDSNIEYISVDIHHTRELLKTVSDVEYIIWLVHASVPATQDESLMDDFLLNIAPIIRFIEKADELTKLRKFIYLSSGGTVYGNIEQHFPVLEQHPQEPISNYGLSKSVAEKYIRYITRSKPFETIVLRPSNVYGPHQNLLKPQGIIGFAFKAIRDNHVLDLYDGGKVIRDFIYVKDLANAIEKFLEKELRPGASFFYNIGSSEATSIKQVLDKIEKITEKKLHINHKSSRVFDCEYNVLDVKKIEHDINWQNETDLDKGLYEVWEWIKSEN